MFKKIVCSLLLITGLTLFIGFVNGCSKKNTIEFDKSDAENLKPGIEWLLVSEPYVAFRKAPGFENAVEGEGRRGEIYEVLGKDFVKNPKGSPTETTVWYKIEKGWIDESGVKIYDNKLKANSASLKLISE